MPKCGLSLGGGEEHHTPEVSANVGHEKGRRETQENSCSSTPEMDIAVQYPQYVEGKGSGMENNENPFNDWPIARRESEETFKSFYSDAESNEHLCTSIKLQHKKRLGRFSSQGMHTAIKQEVVSSEESEKGGTYIKMHGKERKPSGENALITKHDLLNEHVLSKKGTKRQRGMEGHYKQMDRSKVGSMMKMDNGKH